MNIKELAAAYGYEEIVSKNDKMYSFIKDEVRMNVYYTTGTVTFQSTTTKIKVHRDILDHISFEKLL